MGELLACFQGMYNNFPEWYGSWEELSYDIVNNIYVPDFIINEDTGASVVLTSHLMVPYRHYWHLDADSRASVIVRINDWTVSAETYGRMPHEQSLAHQICAERNRKWQRYDEKSALYRRQGISHTQNMRFIVMPVGSPCCRICNTTLDRLDEADLDHLGMKHLEGFCE